MRDENETSPLRSLERDLHGPVAYAILPIFAFANAGISLAGISLSDLTHPVTMGVTAGLLIGKPVGILVFVALAVAAGWAQLPRGTSWLQVLAVAFACGIGFTMSLFIAGLAFEHGGGEYFNGDRLGILLGSALSALAGFVLLQFSLPRSANETN